MSQRSAAAFETLPGVQPMRAPHGPPLPDRGNLRRGTKPAALSRRAVDDVLRTVRVCVVLVPASRGDVRGGWIERGSIERYHAGR